MAAPPLHRFERNGRRYAIDTETCFCFECDAISWDVLQHYPAAPANHIYHLLREKHPEHELHEVVGELEWLRATKAILEPPSQENIQKTYTLERGLNRLVVELDEPFDAERATEVVNLLLARSGDQHHLHLELLRERLGNPTALALLARRAFRAARLAGKGLTLDIRVRGVGTEKTPAALQVHALDAVMTFDNDEAVEAALELLDRTDFDHFPKLANALAPGSGFAGRFVVIPKDSSLTEAVRSLERAGCEYIEVDTNAAFRRWPTLEPRALLGGLEELAGYYAQSLVQGRHFRLEPVAGLFHQIFQGTPTPRTDPAGINALAVDRDGAIYPSRYLLGDPEFRVGQLQDATVDSEELRRFDDVGAPTTAVCLDCWAKHLCGGGMAGVHVALSGSFRQPHAPWCGAQRQWMEAAVAAFNELAGQGINFTQIYNTLGRKAARPSFMTLAKAAFQQQIGLRPIAETDAEWLAQWENWNLAAYFTFNERSLLLANEYDREMDSLYPRAAEQEFVLLRKNGSALGLFKLRPEPRFHEAARAWIYFRDPADYSRSGIRTAFRKLLDQGAAGEALRRITIPVGPFDQGLAPFLEAVGFHRLGALRQSLYLHGAYHDVELYGFRR